MIREPVVSVIVPTLATPERRPYLELALESIRSQVGVAIRPIVVANGQRCVPELVYELERRPDLTFIRLTQESLPEALKVGRDGVETEFFTHLDDDDVLLPGSLRHRVEILQANPDVDVVVANGIIRDNGHDTLSMPDFSAVQRDPLRSLMVTNWLLPGSALFRSRAITPSFFADVPKYLECTYLALLLVTKYRVMFLDEPCLVHVVDHPFSVDRSLECKLGRPEALKHLLKMQLPDFVSQHLKSRVARGYHDSSSCLLSRGLLRNAWAAHLRSLWAPGGWRYLPYTRHLLRALFGLTPTMRGNSILR